MSRIAHFNTYPHGGAAVAARRLSSELNRLGDQSTLYWSHSNREMASQSGLCEIPIDRRKKSAILNLLTKPFRIMRRRSIQLAWQNEVEPRDRSLEVFSLAEQFKPEIPDWSQIRADVVQLHWIAFMADWPTFFSAIPDSVPIVWTLHDMNPFSGGCHYSGGCSRFQSGCGSCPQLVGSNPLDVSRRAMVAKRKSLEGKRVHVVSPSEWLAELAMQSPVWPRGTGFSVIRYGLPVDLFTPLDRESSKKEFGIGPDEIVIGFGAESIGNRRKGFAQLLAALNIIDAIPDRPKLTVLLMGSFSPDQKDQQVPGVGRTIQLGYVADEKMQAKFYSACDMVIVPSLEDNQPQMALESMACGTPVVAFETGGVSEFVRDGVTGKLAPVGDSAALASSILELARDQELRTWLGHRSRLVITREFELSQQTVRYRELYGQLLPKRSLQAA